MPALISAKFFGNNASVELCDGWSCGVLADNLLSSYIILYEFIMEEEERERKEEKENKNLKCYR